MKNLIMLTSFLMCLGFSACGQTSKKGSDLKTMKNVYLKITVGGKEVAATLYDNPTARDFIAQLPMTVMMDDFGGKEKIFYPPKKLSTSERMAVSDPKIGDINVYAPWGNIAIFYGDYSGSRDLIRVARISEGISAFNVSGTISKVTFELVEK